MPLQRTLGNLRDNPIIGQILLDAANKLLKLARVVVLRVPLEILVGVERGGVQLVFVKDDGSITVQRQNLRVGIFLESGQVRPRVTLRQNRRDCPPFQRHKLSALEPDGLTLRQEH